MNDDDYIELYRRSQRLATSIPNFLQRLAEHFATPAGNSTAGNYRINYFGSSTYESSRSIWLSKDLGINLHYVYLFIRNVKPNISSDALINYHNPSGISTYNWVYYEGLKYIIATSEMIVETDHFSGGRLRWYNYADITREVLTSIRPNITNETLIQLRDIVKEVVNKFERPST